MALKLLNALPTAWLGILGVGLAVALAVGGLLVVRRIVPSSTLQVHNDVAGFIYAVLGVIYAVLVPFVLVIVWEEFRDALNDASGEAQTLIGLHQDAEQLAGTRGREIIAAEERYARAVIDDEWPRLARGEESPKVDEALAGLEKTIRGVDPRDPRQAILYSHLLDHVDELANRRESRVFDSQTGVPRIMWAVLVIAGAVVVGYTYLYGVERLAAQCLMTAALAAVIAMVLFVILAIDYPFTGDFRVQPDDLRHFLTHVAAAPAATPTAAG